MGRTIINDMKPGTYYIYETDKDGKIISPEEKCDFDGAEKGDRDPGEEFRSSGHLRLLQMELYWRIEIIICRYPLWMQQFLLRILIRL